MVLLLGIQPSSGANMALKRTIFTTLLASLSSLLLVVAEPALAENSEATDETGHSQDQGWRYDTYYIFPLTRHMPDSELPMAGQIALYPFAFAIDLVQWPFGVLVGLGGE